MKKNFSKLLALYLPYLLLGLAATNFGEAWRLAEGKEMGDKILSLMSTIPAAFANPLPSLHPLDILVGICCGAGLRLAVYLKSKNGHSSVFAAYGFPCADAEIDIESVGICACAADAVYFWLRTLYSLL